MTSETSTQPASGKSCGQCTECCRMAAVPELHKPAWTLCSKCIVGTGCTIYPVRPQSCRNFVCGWIIAPWMGAELRPDKSHVIFLPLDQHRHLAYCDAEKPDAWRAPHVIEALHHLAKKLPDKILFVRVGDKRLWRVTEDSILPITS